MDRKLFKFYGEMSGAVMLKVLMMVGAFFLGRAIDDRLHTFPIFAFSFLVVAMGLGIWLIYYLASRGTKS